MHPIFSVIIPAHNEEDHIANTINSILAQTEQRFEIIVVNDGSTDNTAKIVQDIAKNTKKRIRLISYNIGHSAAFARNRGIEEAQGKYIVFQDADCYADENLLKNALKWFKSLPIDGIATRTTNTKPKTWVQRAVAAQRNTRWENNYKGILFLEKTSGVNVAIMKTEVVRALGGFNEDIYYFEDNDFTQRFFNAGYTAIFASDVVQYHNDPLTLKESIAQCKNIAKGMKKRGKLTYREALLMIFAIFGLISIIPYIVIFLYTFLKSHDFLGSIYFSILWEIRTLAKLYYFLSMPP